jgi:hypothetical protein
MAEVLVEFDTTVSTRDGRAYRPRACGREAADGRWEGWLEFVPRGADAPIRSARESVQPNRADLVYWAEGLTQVYLDGALARALTEPAAAPPVTIASTPSFPGPRTAEPGAAAAHTPHAVLDPFEVYAQGPDLLRRQLAALEVGHLRTIALAYGMGSASTVSAAGHDELTAMIIAAAQGLPGQR